MYTYNVGYHTCEEGQDDQLVHEDKYTPKEFEEIVHWAIIVVLKRFEDNKETYMHETIYFKEKDRISYGDLHDLVVDILIEKCGFEKLEFEADWNCFGWTKILKKNTWREYRDKNDTLDRLYKKLKKEGMVKDEPKR